MSAEFDEKAIEVAASIGPFEGFGRLFVAQLEFKECRFEFIERNEIAGGEQFALDDREVDFDLVEPAGVNRGVDEYQVRPTGAQAVACGLATVDGGVVDDPEDAASGTVRLLRHKLGNQAIESRAARLALTAAEQLGPLDIPGGEIGPGTDASIFVFDIDRSAGSGRQSRVLASPRLNARLFIGGDDKIALAERLTAPLAMIEVQDWTGFGCKQRIAREYPTAMPPRPQSILAQPAPEGCAADLRDDALGDHFAPQVRDRPVRQRKAQSLGQFASQRLDVNDDAGGKSELDARRVAARRGQAGVRRRSAVATCLRSGAAYRGERQ
jgi:hypothetical protein